MKKSSEGLLLEMAFVIFGVRSGGVHDESERHRLDGVQGSGWELATTVSVSYRDLTYLSPVFMALV